MTSARTRRRKVQGGWTLIEVMMAMAILIAGGAGILAMQQAATDGNLEARQMTTATAIARMWVERLKRDSLLWTVGGNNNGVTDAVLTQTLYLQAVPPPATTPSWGTPNPPDLTQESYAFDYQGREVLPTSTLTTFCVQDRFQWLPNSNGTGTVGGNTMRADVRVWWRRRGRGVYNPYPACGVGAEAAIGLDPNVHTLTTSVLLHWTRRL